MKRFLALIAIALIIALFIPALIAKASLGPCLQCGSTNTFERYKILDGDTKTFSYCWWQERQYYKTCSNCGFETKTIKEKVEEFHSISYQDMGCSGGVHTWNRYCTKCGYSIIQRVQCPGPPHCVSPS